MLSVLIPTFNYNALTLVTEIDQQCLHAGIVYEILVIDDASTDLVSLEENRKINQRPNCCFKTNTQNLGRARNLNLLIQEAQYEWLLLMDCDTFPKEPTYLKKYIEAAQKRNADISFGGICYKKEVPEKKTQLRWIYGKKREEISVTQRRTKPYDCLLTSNILCHRDVFEKVPFNALITEYGYEDLVFAKELERNNLNVNHIDNPTFHLNYETSEVFLEKTEKALQTLIFIEKNELIERNCTKIQKAYNHLVRYQLIGLVILIFTSSKHLLKKQLLSKKPSLRVFDFYKLGVFSLLKRAKE